MMKIVASIVILGLCANVAFGAAVTATSNSGALSSTLLNSTATQILKGTNSTDAANWDSSVAASTGVTAVDAGVSSGYTWFGPGATNDTSYLWGIPSSAVTSPSVTGTNPGNSAPSITAISSIRKRTINNTIVGWANDTAEASVLSDTAVTLSIMGSPSPAVGPGYLALLTVSYDSTTATQVNEQVYITLVSGAAGSASTTKLTTTADVTVGSSTVGATAGCTATTYSTGNVWYDIGSGAYFFTYWKQVVTQTAPSTGTACTGTASTYANTIYLGGIYPNGTQYWTTPISVAASNSASTGISSLIGGGDNWLNATNIYIAYRDSSNTAVYSSKTTKASTTTAVGSPSKLATDSTTGTAATAGYVAITYSPSSVWASNFTYGITVAVTTNTYTTSAATAYTYTNYLNGTSTGVDSGLSSSGAQSIGSYQGWQLNTGYTVVASWATGSSSPYPTSYTYATYYGNGTANMTATSLGSLTYSSAQFYEDVNGTMWIGWTDVDYGNSDYTYNAYLAKFQGNLNVPSGASVLSVISVFALFLAAIFVF